MVLAETLLAQEEMRAVDAAVLFPELEVLRVVSSSRSLLADGFLCSCELSVP